MKHQEMIDWFDGSIDKLARQIVDLRYDKTAELLHAIGDCLRQDAEADQKRWRNKLANHLTKTAYTMDTAAASMDQVRKICEPHMQEK